MSDVFPRFFVGDDVDVVCRDVHGFADHIRKVLPGCDIKTVPMGIQVDLRLNELLIIKFDLLRSTDIYGIDTDDLFNQSQRFANMYKIPCVEHELQIRKLEYAHDTSKTWHKDYINNHAPGLFSHLEQRT